MDPETDPVPDSEAASILHAKLVATRRTAEAFMADAATARQTAMAATAELNAYKASEPQRFNAEVARVLGACGTPPVPMMTTLPTRAPISRSHFEQLTADDKAAHVKSGGKILD